MARITDQDLKLARCLPDDFVTAAAGDAVQRLIEIVGENWIGFGIEARMELVDALLPIVDPLLEPGARVTNAERRACEEVVVRWLDGL